ncbi:hypothetical protein GCM10027060_26470 [Nesterenkonia halophila]
MLRTGLFATDSDAEVLHDMFMGPLGEALQAEFVPFAIALVSGIVGLILWADMRRRHRPIVAWAAGALFGLLAAGFLVYGLLRILAELWIF